jgi:hypothetical protein
MKTTLRLLAAALLATVAVSSFAKGHHPKHHGDPKRHGAHGHAAHHHAHHARHGKHAR